MFLLIYPVELLGFISMKLIMTNQQEKKHTECFSVYWNTVLVCFFMYVGDKFWDLILNF